MGLPEQQQIVLQTPPSDDGSIVVWLSGVIVPIVLTAIGLYLTHRRR